MMQPVLFKEALQTLCSDLHFDLLMQIGPHPALKGPASKSIQELDFGLPTYVGTLRRGLDDFETIADSFGTIWSHFPDYVQFDKYASLISGHSNFKPLKDLPSYFWDHDREFWQESRQSKAFRSRGEVYELLGHLGPDSNEQISFWRHVLRISEVPWLQGHKLQGQTVFPAAGYVVLAIEAALKLAGARRIHSIEICNVNIKQALTFNDDDLGIETIFTIVDITRPDHNSLRTPFMYHSSSGKSKREMILIASGELYIEFGMEDNPLLPLRTPPELNLTDIETNQFYSSLRKLGYEYSGVFEPLSSLQRKLGWATGYVSSHHHHGDNDGPLLVHPGMLDAAIQSILLAYCYPGDGILWSLHVPTSIDKITLDMS